MIVRCHFSGLFICRLKFSCHFCVIKGYLLKNLFEWLKNTNNKNKISYLQREGTVKIKSK